MRRYIGTVSVACKSSCSGWGRPRSAKTFPLLFSILTCLFVLAAMLVLPFSVNPFGVSQAATDEVHVLLRRSDAPFRFFLEGVQDVNGLRIADCIDRTPCAAFVIRDNFKHGPSTKTSQRLRGWIGFTLLGSIKGLAEIAPDFAGEVAQLFPVRADPNNRALRPIHYT